MTKAVMWLLSSWVNLLLFLVFLLLAGTIWWLAPVAPYATLSHSDKLAFAGMSTNGRVVLTKTIQKVGSGLDDRPIIGEPIRLWDVATGRQIPGPELSPNTDPVFSPDGKLMAAVPRDGGLQLLDVVGGHERASLKQFARQRSWGVFWKPTVFSQDSKMLALAAAENRVALWDVAAGKEVAAIEGQHAIAFSPDGKSIATSGSRGPSDTPSYWVKLFNAQTGQQGLTLEGHSGPVVSLAFSGDGKLLASGVSGDYSEHSGEIKVWEVASGREQAAFPSICPIGWQSFEANDRLLFIRATIGGAFIWDMTQTPPQQLKIGADDVVFSPDGRLLAFSNNVEIENRSWAATLAGKSDGKPKLTDKELERCVAIWDTTTMQEVTRFQPQWPNGDTQVLGFSADSQFLIVKGCWTQEKAGKLRAVRRLAQGRSREPWSDESEVQLFDLNGRNCGTLEGQRRYGVTLSPDGQTLVGDNFGSDYTIRLFALPFRKPLATLSGLWLLAAIPFLGVGWWNDRRRRRLWLQTTADATQAMQKTMP